MNNQFQKRKSKLFIRSTKTSLKFCNTNKHQDINTFLNEYKITIQAFIDILWKMEKIPSLLPKEITSQIDTWLTARAVQCAAKQASSIVRGTRRKQQKRIAQHKILMEQNHFKKARKLMKVIEEVKMSKPEFKNVSAELDSRFVKIEMDSNTSFDGWITLTNLGNKMKIISPFKKTIHFNKLMDNPDSKLRPGIRIDSKNLTFMFEFPKKNKEIGKTIGLDIGMKSVFTTSDNQVSREDEHGWTMEKIQEKLARRQKDSIGFRKAQTHRKNYVNRTINQLNLNNVKTLRIEKIKNLRKGKRTSRQMSHWTYADISDKLRMTCEDLGVQVKKVNPAYTSQRCSTCGWTRKKNRKGKLFVCSACNFACDADLNAAWNISLELPEISWKQRQKQPNRKGFYWIASGQEFIVPDVQKA